MIKGRLSLYVLSLLPFSKESSIEKIKNALQSDVWKLSINICSNSYAQKHIKAKSY